MPEPIELDRTAARARELQVPTRRHPDDIDPRHEIARSWHLAGDHERALEVLAAMAADGGVDGEYAQVSAVEILLGLGHVTQAQAALAAIRAAGPQNLCTVHHAGETFEARGELVEALAWFDLGAERLNTADMTALWSSGGTASWMLLHGRRRVRTAMGLAADEFDALLDREPAAGRRPALEMLAKNTSPDGRVRLLFWPRGERTAAVARFGETFLVDDPRREGEEHDLLEAELRELARRGAVSIALISATVASLAEWLARTGADLDVPGTRADYLHERMATATATRWPPPRNGPCWCGSAVKYKKCCGRASVA